MRVVITYRGQLTMLILCLAGAVSQVKGEVTVGLKPRQKSELGLGLVFNIQCRQA